ncbi:DedA family protein [Cumulibacter soli]|uniref:DedA family protein n=1 Tax=Cumulibacter soli TaxID=2546344 RepID=UPI001067FBCA|nr:VTT domain-containing protein [Cumulibacter soli]
MWDDVPVTIIFVVLWSIAMLRGQATYWIARWATEATADGTALPDSFRARFAAWLQRPLLVRARRMLEGWGSPLIALCYLTVGLQTAVLASAGVLRMHWLRFTLAQVVGALGWAGFYTFVGASAWKAVLGGVSGTTWLLILAVIAVVMLGMYLVKRTLVRRRMPAEPVG